LSNLLSSELRITEIFHSLQGETDSVGIPTVFVRLTGCPLRCGYCDTAYAFKGGEKMSFAAIEDKIASYDCQYVTVTGGEPLAQPNCIELLKRLCDKQYRVSLETSGAIDVAEVDSRVVKIIDLKTPGSGELKRNLYSNLDYLEPHDQVKFVICDEEDYIWTKETIKKYDLLESCPILFSPSYQQLSEKTLADWILRDRLPVRFQIQLHKHIWGDKPGV
jgi:7-carboxy-7-deazaguanine synthase